MSTFTVQCSTLWTLEPLFLAHKKFSISFYFRKEATKPFPCSHFHVQSTLRAFGNEVDDKITTFFAHISNHNMNSTTKHSQYMQMFSLFQYDVIASDDDHKLLYLSLYGWMDIIDLYYARMDEVHRWPVHNKSIHLSIYSFLLDVNGSSTQTYIP